MLTFKNGGVFQKNVNYADNGKPLQLQQHNNEYMYYGIINIAINLLVFGVVLSINN